MKRVKPVFLSVFMFFFLTHSLGQEWKQYSDSAKVFQEQKKADKAIELYRKAQERLKKDSAGTISYAASCHALAFLYFNTLQYQKAEPLYAEALQIRKNLLGKEHRDYAASCINLAILYREMGQYAKAEPLALEAKQIQETVLGKDHPEYAASCANLAKLYRIMGHYHKAEPLALEAQRICENVFGKEHPHYAASCNILAQLYRNMGQYEKAFTFAFQAKQIQEKVLGKEHPDYAASCNILANLYWHIAQYDKALTLSLEAKQIQAKVLGKDHPDYAASCNTLAILYRSMGQYDKVEPLSFEAKQIQEKVFGKNHPEYAASCNTLAILYRNMGQYDKAEPVTFEAKQIREKILGKQHPDYALSCNFIAVLYLHLGQYEKALPLSIEAKQIQEKALGKQHSEYATSCNTLGILYRYLEQYDKAEPLLLEAKEIREKVLGKQHPDYALSCDNLSSFFEYIGQYEKALALCLEAKEIREKALGKKHAYAVSCYNLADLYLFLGQYKKTESLYLETIRIYEAILGKKHPDYLGACNYLAFLYQKLGQYKKAEPLHLKTKQIQKKVLGEEHPDYAQSCTNLGNLYGDIGQYAKAERLFLEAKQIRSRLFGKQHMAYAQSCDNMARLYWALHRPSKAEREFEESFTVNAYKVFSAFQFTNEKEKAAFLKNVSGEDDKMYSFYLSEKIKSGHPYNVSLFHRNLILSSSQALKKHLFSSNDSALINTYSEWVNVKKYLSLLYSRPVNKRKDDAAAIEEKAGQLEKVLARSSPHFKKQQQAVDWKDIKAKLQADEASVEFASFTFKPPFSKGRRLTDSVFYVALVLRKDSLMPAMVFLFNEKRLNSLLASTGNERTNHGAQNLYSHKVVCRQSGADKSIYELVWKPLEKELKGIKTIYFALCGKLNRLAFAALPINTKEVLSDRYTLVQLTTTASLIDQQPSFVTIADKIQLFGDISYRVDTALLKDAVISYNHEKAVKYSFPPDVIRSGAWNALPGTKKEINDIVSLSGEHKINITSVTGINATEERLKAMDGRASPAVLHIATHGFFFPDPTQDDKAHFKMSIENGKVFKLSNDPLMRSGLLFAGANHAWQNGPVEGIDDGILTAYEVSNLYLPNTKLVVLSACETGLGDVHGAEGVYGLQRAFRMAGAENLIMSLWKVADLETAEFMQLFYKNLFAKQSISDAFHSAQEVMKNKYRLQPYKWAAWVLVR